jgi:BirA family transcriptional regulator, biotin operon repressor / biotin---[acetyl-CoA-carboxylase] ligase|tara:strand:- start:231 stop:785 length:555 start_codon:yes stop_codon:yes gene_type:complete
MKFKKFKFTKVKSTNDTAIRIIKNLNYKYGMVISDSQINGRGQYGKKWISYKGNLFVSFFYEIKNIKLSVQSLAKINCLLVKKLLTNYYRKKILFKKPNDLLIEKKKISGILQETINILDSKFLIVGIGINLIKSPKIKNYPTTNLYELINKHINKTEVENKLKLIFEENLSKLYKINTKLNNL